MLFSSFPLDFVALTHFLLIGVPKASFSTFFSFGSTGSFLGLVVMLFLPLAPFTASF
ncbi:hypothetical protein RHGRI_018588 [Rhododendron griersonianum]|uniref:Uncharacterized protein n=1 Tax=Rhododendron griersonianum TaxID=479676 RepID=A0AAV6K271_9ERIC|nr:hypothetical protein RHGRI_018588 [Rhododendron griersonianum]